ncbi:hypothetical protein M0813_14713 [Anaeramoeba flamelloides]|uniref:Uncharacterized protein n=1 Tax=Anaeramoeba flamelloides TaxID=1746091 RepID=A0ABQ8Z5I7_9EUKA|nr:hypothetical protein M0813_14713 [Anaeramoeba flamelloides]
MIEGCQIKTKYSTLISIFKDETTFRKEFFQKNIRTDCKLSKLRIFEKAFNFDSKKYTQILNEPESETKKQEKEPGSFKGHQAFKKARESEEEFEEKVLDFVDELIEKKDDLLHKLKIESFDIKKKWAKADFRKSFSNLKDKILKSIDMNTEQEAEMETETEEEKEIYRGKYIEL